MSRAPATQLYWKDWCSDPALRRCSWEAQGALPHILLVLHQSDEYGVARWPLKELARISGIPYRLARELSEKNVLKGGDAWSDTFFHVPRHAGKDGEPVALVEGDGGSCWFLARFVRDNWRRKGAGKGTRFTPDNQPGRSPSRRDGDATGDGSAFASASASASSVDTSTHTDSSLGSAPDLARVCRDAGYSECSDKHPDLLRAQAAGVSESVMADAAKAGAGAGKGIGWIAARAIAKAADAITPGSGIVNIEQARGQREANELAERERKAEARLYDIANDFRLEIIDEQTRDDRLQVVTAELLEIRAARASS